MAPKELEELKKQLQDLLDKVFIRSSQCITFGCSNIIFQNERWNNEAVYRLKAVKSCDSER